MTAGYLSTQELNTGAQYAGYRLRHQVEGPEAGGGQSADFMPLELTRNANLLSIGRRFITIITLCSLRGYGRIMGQTIKLKSREDYGSNNQVEEPRRADCQT